MSELKYVQGVFKEELKNRFLCLVEVEGKDTLCYIPSSCRLSNFVDLIGKEVLLTPNSSPNTRTEYAVYALRIRGQFILLNMSQANRLIETNIRNRRFSYLGKRVTVRKEFCVENYKSDLYIEDTQTAVEIKSILSFDKMATFPTVYSQRAIDQLTKLSCLLGMGYKVCYIFVSLNPRVKEVKINEEIVEYYKLFTECINKGMISKGYTIKLQDTQPIIHSELRVIT